MVNNSLEISLKKLRLKTPLMTASGTSGHLDEFTALRNCKKIVKSLGAFVSKGVTLQPRIGNPEVRVIETPTGLLNSIGLQNSGAKIFLEEEMPKTRRYELPIIVNISANTVQEFADLAAYLVDNDESRLISGIEVNVSCPNLKEHGAMFGTNPRAVERVVKAVRKKVGDRVLLITKLTPNVTDIKEPAKAAIVGGTDILSMINTLRGMAIDIENKSPFLGNISGGLSGPAIKPVGVYMVYDCFKNIPECRNRRVPIIGIGGISTWQDVVEYVLAGATAVGIGTAWFVNVHIFEEVVRGLQGYLLEKDTTINDLVGLATKHEKMIRVMHHGR